MRIKPFLYLFGIVLFTIAHLKWDYAVAGLLYSPHGTTPNRVTHALLDHGKELIFKCDVAEPNHPTDTEQDSSIPKKEEPPSDSLEEILKKDANAEGAISNVLGGLALCYTVLANLLFYPIFSFLLLALSLGALVLAWFWIKKIKKEQPISPSWIIATAFYLLCYLDLFLVVFQKKKVLLLFIELERDYLLFMVAIGIGYVAGKVSSSKSFEEKRLP